MSIRVGGSFFTFCWILYTLFSLPLWVSIMLSLTSNFIRHFLTVLKSSSADKNAAGGLLKMLHKTSLLSDHRLFLTLQVTEVLSQNSPISLRISDECRQMICRWSMSKSTLLILSNLSRCEVNIKRRLIIIKAADVLKAVCVLLWIFLSHKMWQLHA